MNPIVLSIPVFFLLIGLEVVYDRFRKTGLYRLNDALTNISCGITEQLSGVFGGVLTVAVYHYFYTTWRIFTVPDTWYWTVILFVMVDFFYYWAHRLSHEINLFWAGHVVHHQSEDYNLSVALRQGAFQKFFTSIVYIPLALIGFKTELFLYLAAWNTLYQFWIHTQTIKSLGWLEYVFNTPSHHRVHHGRDPKYIDKNHAGSLIIWDKLFGTFQKEEEEPVYGITSPSKSWNPVYLQVKHFGDLWADLKRVRGFKNKLRVLFYKPGWLPDELGGYRAPQVVRRDTYAKFNTDVSIELNTYVLLQYLLILGFTSYVLFNLAAFSHLEQVALVLVVFVSVMVMAWLLEGKERGFTYEAARWVVVVAVLSFLSGFHPGVIFVSGLTAVTSLIFLFIIPHKHAAQPTV